MSHQSSPDPRIWSVSGCPVCGSRSAWEFFAHANTPTQDGVLWETREEALESPIGDIRLAFCEKCSYIGNQVHEPEKVRFTGYDVSLQHSPLFQEFIRELSIRLIETYGLRKKHVVDIACGKGHFLKTICTLGANIGTGIDPSCAPEEGGSCGPGQTRFLKEFYSSAHHSLEADLISVRHMIDLLSDPKGLLNLIGSSVGGARGAVVYVEVPLASYTFGNMIVWNVVYEHRSWFTAESLTALFENCGFSVERVGTCWRGEYLGLDARVAAVSSSRTVDSEHVEATRLMLEEFVRGHSRIVGEWSDRIAGLKASGKKVAAWGAGARAITFLNTYDAAEIIPLVVDINPRRQGLYLPRTGHRVGSPETLKSFSPDVIVITNPTYAGEIRKQIEGLGLHPEILVL